MGALTIERKISHLINDQEMRHRESLNPLLKFILMVSFYQPFNQMRSIDKVHPESPSHRFKSEREGKMCFPDTGRPEKYYILSMVNEP